MERLRESSEDDRLRLEKAHRERLGAMDARIRAVRERERRLGALERLQAASAEKCVRLQADIQAIKAQKVRERDVPDVLCWPLALQHHIGWQNTWEEMSCNSSIALGLTPRVKKVV